MSKNIDIELIDHVREYLTNHQTAVVNLDDIVVHLQSYFKYNRRKIKPFRKVVKEAYDIISLENVVDIKSSSSEDEVEQVEVMEENNVMNSTLTDLYSRKKVLKKIGNAMSSSSTSSNGVSKQNDASSTQKITLDQAPAEETVEEKSNEKEVTSNMPIKPTESIKANTPKSVKRSRAVDIDNYASAKILAPFEPEMKKFKKFVQPTMSIVNMADVGGMDDALKPFCELLLLVKKPHLIMKLGMPPPPGFLLHGPSGVGKTLLARAVAGQLNINIIEVVATELIAGLSGDSEERIRDIFDQAKIYAPCVLFIDEIDAIGGNRNNASKDMERRMAAQLISCMDKLTANRDDFKVVVIGATSRPDMLDPALRRVGRFENEVALPIPDCSGRQQILKILCKNLAIERQFDFNKLAQCTPGFVGADLRALVSRAVTFAATRKILESKPEKKEHHLEWTLDSIISAVSDIPLPDASENVSVEKITNEDKVELPKIENIDEDMVCFAKIETPAIKDREPSLVNLLDWIGSPPKYEEFDTVDRTIRMSDFLKAIKVVKPSAKREGFITVPDVTWDDIGSLKNVREELKLAVLAPVKYPERLKGLGLNAPSGVLLCGPPGCGKTLLAKAVANEAGINFISVKGPELMSMYVGESERAVRSCFQRARNSAPCVIFFDEFDSLCPKRSASADSGSGTRIVNQLLTEMDGIEDRRGVYILAATNRPDIIDPAILRPGRLDTILYVGLPELNDRVEILNATTKNRTSPLLHEDVSLSMLGEMTVGFTGADLAGFVRQAAMLALKDTLKMENFPTNHVPYVRKKHFVEARGMVRPSVTDADMKVYDRMRVKYAAPRV